MTSYLLAQVGLTLGVGSSTFALTFYFLALNDGVIDASERRFMHAVYTVLRIGILCFVLSLIGSFIAGSDVPEGTRILQSILLGIIVANAVLMSHHLMPMRFGPTLAGGSWYSLFLVSVLPVYTLQVPVIVALYVGTLVTLHLILLVLKKLFVRKPVS